MFKKEFVTVALLLLTCTFTFAQRDFRKGYIITNQHDTIYGLIDYRGDFRNAKICSFKETKNSQAIHYTPADIAAYRYIDSKFYISKNIGTSDVPNQVFLEYLVNGMANLYFYRDKVHDRYYIEKDGRLHELFIDESEVEIDGKRNVRTVKTYIGSAEKVKPL